MGRKAEAERLTVNASSPFHIFYVGQASSISAINSVGPFDILPGHAGFFSVLKAGEVIIDTGTELVNFTLANGIISVRDNQVELFGNI